MRLSIAEWKKYAQDGKSPDLMAHFVVEDALNIGRDILLLLPRDIHPFVLEIEYTGEYTPAANAAEERMRFTHLNGSGMHYDEFGMQPGQYDVIPRTCLRLPEDQWVLRRDSFEQKLLREWGGISLKRRGVDYRTQPSAAILFCQYECNESDILMYRAPHNALPAAIRWEFYKGLPPELSFPQFREEVLAKLTALYRIVSLACGFQPREHSLLSLDASLGRVPPSEGLLWYMSGAFSQKRMSEARQLRDNLVHVCERHGISYELDR